MTPTSAADAVATLARVATTDRPAPSEAIEALLSLEKALKKTPVPIPWAAIVGTWQLRLASGARKTKRGLKLGKGFYLPSWVYAAIGFAAAGRIQNQLRLGALEIRFTGPCRLLPRRNIVVFDFTQVQLLLGEKVLYSRSLGKYPEEEFATRPVAQLPFFVFLWASPMAIAARGRGGGLAIWVKAADG
jgi:hypothetical protein